MPSILEYFPRQYPLSIHDSLSLSLSIAQCPARQSSPTISSSQNRTAILTPSPHFSIFLGDFVARLLITGMKVYKERGIIRLDTRICLPSSLTSPLSFHHGPARLNFHNLSKETEASESIKLWDLICFYCSIYALNIECSSVPIFMIVSFNY